MVFCPGRRKRDREGREREGREGKGRGEAYISTSS